jgi:hypothetical protein
MWKGRGFDNGGRQHCERSWVRSPPPLPSIFLMDGHLTKTRGGKKGQIRPMIRFCVFFFSGAGDSRIAGFLQMRFPLAG